MDKYKLMRYWDQQLTSAISTGNSSRIAYCLENFNIARKNWLSKEMK